jgi:OmpA-OmpF porin, OOP family
VAHIDTTVNIHSSKELTMLVRKLLFALLFIVTASCLSAQTDGAGFRSLTPADSWEVGVDLGLPFIAGDIDSKFPGFGAGLHVRKALDHIFSVRVNGNFGQVKNENDGNNRSSETTWLSGSGQLVVAVNNIRFNKPTRKVLFNVFGGLGVNNFEATAKNVNSVPESTVEGTNAIAELGAGLAFRVSPRFNLGLEYTVASVLGGKGDLLEGDNNAGADVTTFRDYYHFPHLSLNFNLGGKNKDGSKKSEPLYWANPLAMTGAAITALEARAIYDPTDNDGDGIINDIDEEDDTPAGARVDSKGRALDSDGDKVLDYKDKEPYSPPGFRVDAMGVAQVPKPITEDDVNRIVDAKIAAIKLPTPKATEWFLPLIYFGDNRYNVRATELEKLYQVATVLKNNPDLKVVVVGHTDARGSEGYNNVLSYNRANAAITALTSQFGVARERLILNWTGEGSKLEDSKGSSVVNRRVEFRVAKGETEMARPDGPDAGKGSFKGNKGAGY